MFLVSGSGNAYCIIKCMYVSSYQYHVLSHLFINSVIRAVQSFYTTYQHRPSVTLDHVSHAINRADMGIPYIFSSLV